MFRSLLTAALSLTFAQAAFAQTDMLSSPLNSPFRSPASNEPKKLGWTEVLTLSGNLSFSSSQDVIGQTDGNSQTYGLNVKGGANRVSEADEWRNTLSILEATSRTPALPTFVKASDELRLETIYLYSLPSYPKVGPYVSGLATTPMFKGEDVRGAPTNYSIQRKGQPAVNETTDRIKLTDGFTPLETRESIGFFYKPLDESSAHIELRLGFAGQQINAGGQLTVGKADATGAIPVTELSDINQAGLEAAAGVKGKVNDNSSYEVSLSSLTPFINNKASDDHRDAFVLTDVEGAIKLTSKITSWASFGYDYKLKIQPQLLTRAQQIHLLTLNVNYNIL